jgi:hypothetical protein
VTSKHADESVDGVNRKGKGKGKRKRKRKGKSECFAVCSAVNSSGVQPNSQTVQVREADEGGPEARISIPVLVINVALLTVQTTQSLINHQSHQRLNDQLWHQALHSAPLVPR